MRVTMYTPGKLYGFAQNASTGREVFFHQEVFWSGDADGQAPPPIVGEEVRVEYDPTKAEEGRPPRASRVDRVNDAVLLFGKVERFDPLRGWGFLMSDEGMSYHLHRSEVQGGRLPLSGSRVSFYGGARKSRPRACYVTVF